MFIVDECIPFVIVCHPLIVELFFKNMLIFFNIPVPWAEVSCSWATASCSQLLKWGPSQEVQYMEQSKKSSLVSIYSAEVYIGFVEFVANLCFSRTFEV